MPDTQGALSRTHRGFIERVLIVAAVIVLVLLAWAWRQVVLLAFASILIAVGLHGIADPLTRRTPLGRGPALVAAGLLLLSAVVALFWLFGAQLEGQVSSIFAQLPDAWARVRAALLESQAGAALVFELENWFSGANGESPIGSALTRVGGVTLSFATALTQGLLVLFAAVFLATGFRSYKNGALLLMPHRVRDDVGEALDASARALKKWLAGTLISMLSVSIMVGLALWALGVPAFFALALIAGVAQFVPVLGPLIAALPGVLIALTVSPQTALWAATAYFAASQLESNLIYPLVQQRAVSLPPALSLFTVIAMGLIFGPLGVLLATPILVVCSVFIVKLYVRGVLKEDVAVPGS